MDYPALMRYTPEVRGQGWFIFMISFCVLFVGVCLLMLFAGGGSTPAVFAVVIMLMIVGVLAFMAYILARWRRFKRTPIQRLPAIVLDKRTEVSSGDYTYYYVTLVKREGRQEYSAEGNLYGMLSKDDKGVAYIKDSSLLEFSRLVLK